METMRADGVALPSSGMLTVYEPASGPGVRVDGYGYGGFPPEPEFRFPAGEADRSFPVAAYEDAILRARRA